MAEPGDVVLYHVDNGRRDHPLQEHVAIVAGVAGGYATLIVFPLPDGHGGEMVPHVIYAVERSDTDEPQAGCWIRPENWVEPPIP